MKILKIKATLEAVKPEIYREILIDGGCTYDALHLAIQKAFGWANYHPYVFQVDKKKIGDMDEDEDDELRLDLDSHIQLMRDKKTFTYTYDLEDKWVHGLQIIEEIEAEDGTAVPVCTGGMRACPPEECGGAAGYGKLMKTAKNGLISWEGDEFDPEFFTVDWANARLRDPNCCRFGLTVEEIAESAGKPVAAVRKLVEKIKDKELKDQMWEEDGLTLIGAEGITSIYQHLGV